MTTMIFDKLIMAARTFPFTVADILATARSRAMRVYRRLGPALITGGLALIILAFLWGAAAGRYGVFPFSALSALKTWIAPGKPKRALSTPESLFLPEQAYVEDTDKRIAAALANPQDLRNRIKARIIFDDVTVKPVSGSDGPFFERFLKRHAALAPHGFSVTRADVYGLAHYGVLIKAGPQPSGKLLVYNQGHWGAPFKFDFFHEIVRRAHRAGIDVLALSMSLKGFNFQDETSFPTRYGPGQFKKIDHHDYFYTFFDKNHPERSGIGLLASGNYWVVRDAIDTHGYGSVAMVGISGGGWYTTILPAIVPEIKISASFAGTAPIALRGRRRDFLDYEHVMDPFWHAFRYWDFYALATLDGAGAPGRTHLQIYIEDDFCCLDGGTARVIQRVYGQTRRIPGMEFVIVPGDRHAIDPDIVSERVLSKM